MRSLPAHLSDDSAPLPRREESDLDRALAIDFIHRKFTCLDGGLSVAQAVERLQRGVDESRIHYFYVVDDRGKLTGIMPTRRFLLSEPERLLSEICVRDLVTIPSDATLAEAARIFERHRFLALPVVDRRGSILGVLDLHVFADRKVDVSNRAVVEEVFQTIGIRLGGLVGAGPLKSWRLRFPWLLSTLAGGALCVAVSAAFESTLASSVILAVFLAPILALGESTAIQSMSIALQVVGGGKLGLGGAIGRTLREALTGILLGAASGSIIWLLQTLWKGSSPLGLSIAASAALAMGTASSIGFILPWILYRFRVNLKVAAGPIVLAIADVATILLYLGLAALTLASA